MTSFYRRRSILAFAGLAAAVPVLAACSSGKKTGSSAASSAKVEPTSSVPTGMPDGKGSGQADGVFPRTVVHFKGSTEIPAAPSKVVILSTGQLDVALTLGIVPIGSTKGDGAETVPEYLKKAFPDHADQLGSITDVGSRKSPSVEDIGNLSPDLILVNQAGKDDIDALYSSLSAVAPTVVTQGKSEAWKQDFLLVADALGKPDTAKKWIETYQSDAAKAGSAIEGNPTVSLLRHNEERLRIFGPISTAGSVLADMGVARPDTQQFTDEVSKDISAEQLEQANGDWLFYGVQGGDASKVTSLDLWQALTPVDAKQAVQVDDDAFFLNAGPTAIRTILTTVSDSLKK